MSVILGSGEHRYRVNPDWAKLPDGWSFTDVAGAVRHLAGGPDRAVLIGDRDRARFLAAAAGLSPVAGPAVRGFNYSRGRWTELTLYRPG